MRGIIRGGIASKHSIEQADMVATGSRVKGHQVLIKSMLYAYIWHFSSNNASRARDRLQLEHGADTTISIGGINISDNTTQRSDVAPMLSHDTNTVSRHILLPFDGSEAASIAATNATKSTGYAGSLSVVDLPTSISLFADIGSGRPAGKIMVNGGI